jgi:SHS2 domain-containing protein
MSSPSGHRAIEHTADLALEIWAPTEAALLAEGAAAVVEILTDGQTPVAHAERRITVDGLDRQDRLVQWLNDVLVLAVTEGFLTAHAEIALDGAGGLAARVFGEENAKARIETELKSVTYHELRLSEAGGQWTAFVVIDV